MSLAELAPSIEAPSRSCAMIAEDYAEINNQLAEALRELGCEVVQAFDGLEAYERARQRRPRVILLDLDLPRLYGQVVMRSLRRDPATADVRVVVLTARPELLTPDDQASAFAILYKPADLDDIVRAVRAALLEH
jgi:two-component system phosphate regulon response regulator PhoB